MYNTDQSWTILQMKIPAMQDMRHFKAMLRKVDNTFVKDLALKSAEMEALQTGVLAP